MDGLLDCFSLGSTDGDEIGAIEGRLGSVEGAALGSIERNSAALG